MWVGGTYHVQNCSKKILPLQLFKIGVGNTRWIFGQCFKRTYLYVYFINYALKKLWKMFLLRGYNAIQKTTWPPKLQCSSKTA